MNQHSRQNCERFEAMISASFDSDAPGADEREALSAHMASCPSCRESFELSSRMETMLLSRRDEVPAVDAFLPAFVTARAPVDSAAAARTTHPKLLAAFRAFMSPAGISITLMMWATLLALHFRSQISAVFVWTSSDRFSALGHDISNFLMGVARGDTLVLTGIYVALTVLVLGSMGLITLRYVRHS
jgi:predicted anti-sigma-YlaC factor YlaD